LRIHRDVLPMVGELEAGADRVGQTVKFLAAVAKEGQISRPTGLAE